MTYARHIVQRIQDQRATSSYGYAHCVTLQEGERPHYAYTCYGFLDHVLTTTHPRALDALLALQKTYLSDLPPSFDGKILPYHLVMLGDRLHFPTEYWTVIRDIRTIQRGDILSYMDEGYTLLKDPPLNPEGTGTHVMFVDQVEGCVEEDDRILLKIWIMDATGRPHNRLDSRYHHTPRLRQNGIGRSPMTLCCDKSFKRFWIQWSNKGRIHEKLMSILRFIVD